MLTRHQQRLSDNLQILAENLIVCFVYLLSEQPHATSATAAEVRTLQHFINPFIYYYNYNNNYYYYYEHFYSPKQQKGQREGQTHSYRSHTREA